MKTLFIFSAFILSALFVFPNKITITNTGLTFSPDSISIRVGDTVVFQIDTIHNAVEVSHATWTANGNTPLPGFSVPFKGGQVTGLAAGVHYYVCQPHAYLGMKGRIFVSYGLGTNAQDATIENTGIYPNPTTGKFMIRRAGSGFQGGITRELLMDIYNMAGEKIISGSDLPQQDPYEMDLTAYPDGLYFLSFVDDKVKKTIRIVKRK
jgi:plastocyanin